MTAREITNAGFLSEFKRCYDLAHRPFCWILGSGASFNSGIPTGGSLVYQWLKEMHEMEVHPSMPIEQWATAENLGIEGFQYAQAPNFYPWIYQRRFLHKEEQGYAFLESVMDHGEPSFGYSVLAQIMGTPPHNVAVTTNFDNLIADALSIYTRVLPLVCGHELLASFIRPNMRRPLIAKIHRDLLLNPLGTSEETAKLSDEWAAALEKIFDRYTPIVVGYGGNDGSLMGFLQSLKRIEGGIFWCYLVGSPVEEKIHGVVEHHNGSLVPILGFDELMLQLQEKLQLPFLLPKLQNIHDRRVSNYQTHFEQVRVRLEQAPKIAGANKVWGSAVLAAQTAIQRAGQAAVAHLNKEKDWWAWQWKANAEQDLDKREAIFEEGVKDFPRSADLVGNFAVFMQVERRKYNDAEQLYRKALEIDPNHARNTANFAMFMQHRNIGEADELYRKVIELEPKNAAAYCAYGQFMEDIRKDENEALRLYGAALNVDPGHIWASWLSEKREQLLDKKEAILVQELNEFPTNAKRICELAVFKQGERKKYDETERLYQRALEVDPSYVYAYVLYGRFMQEVRTNKDEARRLYLKALELDPTNIWRDWLLVRLKELE